MKCNSTPKKEWAINKTKEMQHAQHAINAKGTNQQQEQANEQQSVITSTTTSSTTDSSSDHPFWAGRAGFFQVMEAMIQGGVSFLQLEDLKDLIMLNSASSAHVFCNEKMLDRMWDTQEKLTLAMNGGLFQTSKKGNVPGCDEVWVSNKLMTNIFSLALLADKFCITFDSAVENAFHVHTPFGVVKFTRGPENIYYTKPNEFINQSPPESGNKQEPFKGHFPQTVADNAQFYMKQQVLRAKAAQDLLHAVGCPSVADLKNILKMNSIANCPITLDDIDIAEEIYGPDVASLKGKTTR